MHILMISDVFFPRINGVSTSIENFRQALAAAGIRSTLIAPAYPGAAADDDPDILRIPSRYLPMDPEDRLMRRSAIRALLPELRRREFTLVHIHTPFAAHYAGLDLARELGLPCVATYHTFFEEYLFHYIPFLPQVWLRSAARRFSCRQCNALDAVIVPSTAMADTLRRYGVTRPLHVLPTGLPESRFAGGDGGYFRSRYEIAGERPLLLFVGRVAHEKNIGFLLGVIDRVRRTHPSALLLVTGEGPALAGLAATVQERGLNEHVRFLGYLDRHSELHDCYRAADLFVFASRTETQGLVLLEAMALGTPVVALAEMGTRDILGPQRGCRIAPDDEDGFAELVTGLLDEPARLQALGVEARRYAREWQADEMARRLAALYRGWARPETRLLDDLQVGATSAARAPSAGAR
ncbi:glycosyltransferase [Pseudothauera rhizosphaerae]|uniref:Glycosyltransferase family 4 protein n=1 Tax=Pseudothauera rhizosphaerae TaxID=2565932 RepID=A0A4S4AK56_9RHOO|nr:glycosyltransferase [Pseudothauera rhizosphaerae]THF59293.1 glycosyltransferase family 4 protein [Pseudothauera rhizosphaerae]